MCHLNLVFKISTIIPCHNRKETTIHCIEKLQLMQTDGFSHHIYVVDDGSTDGTVDALQRKFYGKVLLLRGDGSLWWTGAVNMGIQSALGDGCDWVHLINDDITFEQNFLFELFIRARLHRNRIYASISCDIVDKSLVVRGGARLNKKLRSPLKEINGFRLIGDAFTKPYAVDVVSGRSVLIPACVFRRIGIFNQQDFPHQFADFDLFLRARRAGFGIYIVPTSRIYTNIEPKFAILMLRNSRLKAILNLWFDERHFGMKLYGRLARRITEHRVEFLALEALRKFKWTLACLCLPKSTLATLINRERK